MDTIIIQDGFRAITSASKQASQPDSITPPRNPSAIRPQDRLKTQNSAQSQALKKATSLAIIKLIKSPSKGHKKDMFLPCKGIGGYFGNGMYNSKSGVVGVGGSDVRQLTDDKSLDRVEDSGVSLKSRNLVSAVSRRSQVNEKGEFYSGWKPGLKKIVAFDKPSYYVDWINPRRMDFNRYLVGGMPNVRTGPHPVCLQGGQRSAE
jgi:hypothetical protein